MLSKISYFLIVLLFSGCNHNNIKKFPLYTQTIIDRANPFPEKKELTEMYNIVVMVDDDTKLNIYDFNQKAIALSSLENLLNEYKNINIIDRGILKTIKEELIFAELKNHTSSIKNKDADYIFLIKMNSLLFSNSYDNRTFGKMAYSAAKIGLMIGGAIATKGRGVYIDAGENPVSGKYYYKAIFNGDITIIKMPSAEKIATIPIIGTIEDEESSEANTMSKPKENDTVMLKNAINEGIRKAANNMKLHIPSTAHIILRYDYREDEPALFKISSGSKHNINIGDKVILSRTKYDINPLNQEKMTSIINLPLGTIIENDYSENFSWVKVEDKALASTIKVGEKVIIYTKDIPNIDNDD